jgi:uncharacterized membrane protein YccC
MNNKEKTWLVIASVVISANIAFFLYNYFHWSEGYWSVVSIAAVATAEMTRSFDRMVARIFGTLFGAFYAYTAVTYLPNHPLLLAVLLGFGIFLTTIISLQKHVISYAGIVGGLTIVTVFAAGISEYDFYNIATSRTYQVCIGIIISALVSSILYKIFAQTEAPSRLFLFKFREHYQAFKKIKFDKTIYIVTLKVILATLITFLPWLYWRYPGGFWATISCFFIIEESFAHTQKKAFYRFAAHFVTAGFGLLAALLIGNKIILLCVPLSIGLAVCGYILAQDKPYSGIGNTMGIALCVMLLTDPGVASTTIVILSRFINVLFGVAIGIMLTALPFNKLLGHSIAKN